MKVLFMLFGIGRSTTDRLLKKFVEFDGAPVLSSGRYFINPRLLCKNGVGHYEWQQLKQAYDDIKHRREKKKIV